MADSSESQKSRRDQKILTPEEIEIGRSSIISAVLEGRRVRLQDKVAWILNHFPNTRDSDISLSLKFWEKFESEYYNNGNIEAKNLFKLTKQTSLTRERARIQNIYNLYLASPEVRKMRGKLQEEEYEKVLEQNPRYPVSIVYADESGKNEKYLLVGSLWFIDGYETLRIQNEIEDWKKANGINYEFHFTELTKGKLSRYVELVDLVYLNSALLSFKGIYLKRITSRKDEDALEHLFYHLIVKGLDHDHQTNRAPFPRAVQFWKDKDGEDKLVVENLKSKLFQASVSQYKEKLSVDSILSVDSLNSIHIQLTDLFTGCLNRKINYSSQLRNQKDDFSDYFINKFKIEIGPLSDEIMTLFPK